jgi:DtxR family Mn-dependent transcriptional regulator
MPSATLEEYLETIYKISLTGSVRPTQLAEALSVSGATVTATLRRLETAGLVSRPEGGVALTDAGRREAMEVVRRHRIAERFLVDALGLPWDAAHEEACRLEHAMSPRVLEALETFLDNPSVCPHGHPIPAMDGTMAELVGRPLAELVAGDAGRVTRVGEDDEEVLAYLGSLGLYLGAGVKVVEAAPFNGPLLISVDGREHPLAREIADGVSVEVVS